MRWGTSFGQLGSQLVFPGRQRQVRGSIVLTSNKSFGEWCKLLGDGDHPSHGGSGSPVASFTCDQHPQTKLPVARKRQEAMGSLRGLREETSGWVKLKPAQAEQINSGV
jgi:hypothetical protein